MGKSVIVATQMLESMIHSSTPTRAEVSDVSNAILDGADAIMLSEETAMGEYPTETVRIMREVALEIEAQINYEKRVKREYAYTKGISKTDAITRYAAKTALDLEASAIVAFTETGTTAKMLARFRTKQPIFVISPYESVLRQMQLPFGTYPGRKADLSKKRDVIEMARKLVLDKKIAKKGDFIIVVSGSIFGKPGETNTITVVEV
jgi:pyruvate kinase